MAFRHDRQESEATPVQESAFRVSGFYYSIMPGEYWFGTIERDQLGRLALFNSVAGIIFLLVGTAAIVYPIFSAFALEQLLGWVLIIGGMNAIFASMMLVGAPSTCGFLLLGFLHTVVGIWLVLNPALGIVALMLIMAWWLILHGLVKIYLSVLVRSIKTWCLPFVSGLVSLAFGIYVLFLFPENSVWVLGLIVGIDFIGTGLSLLTLAAIAYLANREGGEPVTVTHDEGKSESKPGNSRDD